MSSPSSSFFDTVWTAAAAYFPKLSPYSGTWKMVARRAEHALFLWNDAYGPLNSAQREYAGSLIAYSFTDALRSSPSSSQKYPFFHQSLTRLLNHERVRDGMRLRASESTDTLELPPVFMEVV